MQRKGIFIFFKKKKKGEFGLITGDIGLGGWDWDTRSLKNQNVINSAFSLSFCYFHTKFLRAQNGEFGAGKRGVCRLRRRRLETPQAMLAISAGGVWIFRCPRWRISTAENGIFSDEMGCFCYLELSIRASNIGLRALTIRKCLL